MNTAKFLKAICLALLALGALRGGVAGQNERGQTAVAKNEPSRQPVLRIETGMHTAVISRIGVDAAGRYLVTGSVDKTVRVWELATGRLLRVLRPPLGAGDEGKIYAVALSPDGSLIAAGGFTSNEPGNTESIYLFDRESGRMVRRMGGLPNIVDHLAFSPDGTGLAAALGEGGIRVFRVADGTEIGGDTDYGAASYSLDIDRAGRLVTSCDDGYLRLYDRNLKLLKKVRAPSGKRPFAVRFTPDGTKVAVGYADSTRVDVLDGNLLVSLYQPDTTGVSQGSLDSVTWSVDGAALYAGGRRKAGAGISSIHRWAEAGRGQHQDLAVVSNAIMDLAPLADGSVVFGTGDPAWGIFSASGQRMRLAAGEIADYRNNREGFLTNSTGSVISFAYEQFGKSPTRFSLAERRLETGINSDSSLQPTRTSGLAVTDWKDGGAPKLDGVKLALEPHEVSHSLAIAPDMQRFLLGTNFALHLFDRNGKELWQATIPGIAWSVNISGDGKLAVAALGDGTIRWYGLRDGKESLAFFPHNDRKRWVLWTPQGYYDASPGAEDLIGWHVNNGKDQAADFFPAGQFRDVYYQPVISHMFTSRWRFGLLNSMDLVSNGRKRQETGVLNRLPPVISIIAPSDDATVSSTMVMVHYTVRTPSEAPVTAVRALVDGRPVETIRDIKMVGSDTQQLRVTIPERDCELAVVAENQYAASMPAVIRLKWRGRTVTDAVVIKPKLYVLAIGVAHYADPDYNLNYPAKDARDFAEAMRQQQGLLYREVVVRLLVDAQATRDEVMGGLDWIRKETTSKDVAMVFLAGHGVNDDRGRYFFCPHNFSEREKLRTGVSFADIKNTVEALAGKTVFFVDTCHAGNALGCKNCYRRSILDDLNRFVNELTSAENGAVVFAASTGKQVSLENKEWNNGAFTKALVEGISGRADYTGKGKITINSLDLYLSERVKELTRGRQTPTTTKPTTVPDFPIAVRQ
jgi:WD40 repeat protein